MSLTDKLLVVSNDLVTYLKAGQSTLGIEDVWEDITGLVPRTPSILVEPDNKIRELTNTGFQTTNTFNVNVIVIHSRMASNTVTNSECLELAEKVETYLHNNRTLAGKLIHSYVTDIQQGSVPQQKVLLRASKLSWRGLSKTRI